MKKKNINTKTSTDSLRSDAALSDRCGPADTRSRQEDYTYLLGHIARKSFRKIFLDKQDLDDEYTVELVDNTEPSVGVKSDGRWIETVSVDCRKYNSPFKTPVLIPIEEIKEIYSNNMDRCGDELIRADVILRSGPVLQVSDSIESFFGRRIHLTRWSCTLLGMDYEPEDRMISLLCFDCGTQTVQEDSFYRSEIHFIYTGWRGITDFVDEISGKTYKVSSVAVMKNGRRIPLGSDIRTYWHEYIHLEIRTRTDSNLNDCCLYSDKSDHQFDHPVEQ